jgi:hypothetical protein
MHHLETHGTWREMGRQLGEALGPQIREAQERFAPWLVREADRYAPALARLRALLEQHCPDVLDEALGMAEGAGMSPEVGLGYRLFNQVSLYLNNGCSVVFVRETDRGPLLGRNCDLGPQELDLQLCHVRRPTGQPATIETTYVGLVAGLCLNEFGLGTAGASAPAVVQGHEGLPGPVLSHRLMHECRTVAQGRALLAGLTFLGKPANYIVADETGDSALFEFVPGLPPRKVTPAHADWQGCTNFLLSEAEVSPTVGSAFARNAYARYGRIAHLLGQNLMARSVDGLHGLLCDIAQPGPVCPPEDGLITAYSHLMDLRARTMHLWPGHPAQVAPVAVTL